MSVGGKRGGAEVLNLVADLLESWIASDRQNSITLSSSLAGRRPAREPARDLVRELDSVMEFGLDCTARRNQDGAATSNHVDKTSSVDPTG